MAKTLYGKPIISNRNGAAGLYSWSPYDYEKKANRLGEPNVPTVGCSLEEDNVVTYVYELLFINGQTKRIPYVVCDYVE